MRKLIITEFITLDGVVEAPGGDETDHPHGGWQADHSSDEVGRYKVDELTSVEALMLGRKTYDQFASYWPGQAGNWFGDRMNQLPKYVVSGSLQQADWNNSHILRDVAKGVAALKQGGGGDILVYGSATLVKSFLHHDLVDELRLILYPVSVGGGLRIFDEGREMNKFSLKSSRALEGGMVILEYVPLLE